MNERAGPFFVHAPYDSLWSRFIHATVSCYRNNATAHYIEDYGTKEERYITSRSSPELGGIQETHPSQPQPTPITPRTPPTNPGTPCHPSSHSARLESSDDSRIHIHTNQRRDRQDVLGIPRHLPLRVREAEVRGKDGALRLGAGQGFVVPQLPVRGESPHVRGVQFPVPGLHEVCGDDPGEGGEAAGFWVEKAGGLPSLRLGEW